MVWFQAFIRINIDKFLLKQGDNKISQGFEKKSETGCTQPTFDPSGVGLVSNRSFYTHQTPSGSAPYNQECMNDAEGIIHAAICLRRGSNVQRT
jgi:hypothetical protein